MLAVAIGAAAANAQPAPQTPATAVPATSVKKTVKSTPKAAPATAPQAGGLVVFIDPVTGQIRQPDAAEIGALTAAPQTDGPVQPGGSISQRHAPVVHREFRTPSGVIGVKLGDESLSYMVVTKTADGKLAEDCVNGVDAAATAVSKGATPRPTVAPAKPKVVLDDK
jgi:hypothetical protein